MTLCAGVNKTLAQSNAPRFGTALGQDNTFRPLTLGVKELADTAGSTIDTVTFVSSLSQRGSIFDMNVKLTLTDSCVLAISSDGNSRYGDRMHLIIANTSGANHKVKFLGYSGLTSQWLMNAASGTTKIGRAHV